MEPQRRHILAESGLVRVSLHAQTLVLPALDSFADLHHPASLRCQLVGSACVNGLGARGWAIWTAFSAREGVTPGFCEARAWRLGYCD